MSQENVETVRRAIEANQRGESWADALHPEMEWDSSAYPGLDAEVQGRGRDNYLRVTDRYRRAWIGYKVALKELIDAGDDVVVVLHETARARGTEMLIERDIAHVVTLRAGRAIRVRAYQTRTDALEAVGLRE
jgi:ketosteroid isomerase-like protein